MKLLDLFCGAGGAAMGYHQAGFDEIVGVDISEQPRYPFRFVKGDVLQVLGWMSKHGGRFPVDHADGRREWLGPFDAVHASPPCQFHTTLSSRWRGKSALVDQHKNWLSPCLARLRQQPVPFVVENVVGARKFMHDPIVLHGGMFGLRVHRPRLFESNVLLHTQWARRASDIVGVYGQRPDGRLLNPRTPKNRAARGLVEGQHAMGIDWMIWSELTESIPPAYTAYIGRQLLQYLTAVRPQILRA